MLKSLGLHFVILCQIIHFMEKHILLRENSFKLCLSRFQILSRARLVQTGVILAILLLGFSGQVTAQAPAPKIHPDDLVNSNDFKNNQGGDRYLIFKKLENLVKPASAFEGPAPAYDYFIGDYKMSGDDLVFLLGEPDEKIAPAIWQYYLTANQLCKVIIGIDENGMISFVVSKGCL